MAKKKKEEERYARYRKLQEIHTPLRGLLTRSFILYHMSEGVKRNAERETILDLQSSDLFTDEG